MISGNSDDGISDSYVGTSPGTLIEGNEIGTDVSGTEPVGNNNVGIYVGSNNDTIGGRATGARNLISANEGPGIYLIASGAVVAGNLIGTDISGTNALGNAGDGVTASGSNNTIGGATTKFANVIAFNRGAGVGVVNNATGVGILSNSIFGNSALGIDLGDDGVTTNTPGGPHGGPNNFENFPVLLAAITYDGRTDIKGSFNGAADEVFTLQFFADPTADPSGFGQGQTYLGQTTVTTDGSGNASFQVSLKTAASAGQFVSATATDPGNDTSEFAADIPIAASAQSIFAVGDEYQVNANTALAVAAPGVQTNDIAANGKSFKTVLVTGPASGKLKLRGDGSFVYTPKSNFTGTDSFTYEDVQGSTDSNIVTVTITVTPNVPGVTRGHNRAGRSLPMDSPTASLAMTGEPATTAFVQQAAAISQARSLDDAALEALSGEPLFISRRRWLAADGNLGKA